MSARRHTLAASLVAALLHPAVWAQEDPARLLIEQGRHWEERGDRDRAGQAWQKLLNIDPDNQLALYGLARIEIAEKRLAGARPYLERLRAIDPKGRYARQLEQDLRLAQPANAKALEAARLQAESGELAQSLPHYRKALEDQEPVGEVGLEYYGRLGYTDGGWEPARRGLERLLRDNPGDPAIQLVLAKLLILNPSTWRDGIERLAELAKRPDVGGEATESWRLGLIWRGHPSPAERPLYTAYLQAYPDDAEVRAVGNSSARAQQPAGHADPLLKRGFAALDKNDLAAAERAFQAKLEQSPNEADALGGLGLVRMEQEQLRAAHELLGRAAQRNARAWTPSLNVARYWILLAEADQAQGAGDYDAAARLAEQARALLPREAGAYNALAGLRAAQDDLAGAENAYRDVLHRHKNDPQALEGLVSVLARQGRIAEARQALEQLLAAKPDSRTDVSRARAALAAGQARAAREAGDMQGARAALEQALREDPGSPWISYELGRLHIETGELAEARRVRQALTAEGANPPNALYAGALLAGEMGDWQAAEQALDRIAPASRTAAMDTFASDVRVQRQAAEATALAKAGRTGQALEVLARLEPELAGRPVRIGAVAAAYVDAGDPERGLALMRQAVAGQPVPATELLLLYAGIQLKAEEDAAFAATMRTLHDRRLSASQQRSYNDLYHLYTIRLADLLREQGDLVAAYDTLAPALAARPDDPLAVSTLARMYSDSGDPAQALELYRDVLARHGDDPDVLMGAALAAAQVGDTRYADSALERALALRPEDPELLVAAARIYRSRGKESKAVKLLEQALALRERNAAERTQLALAPTARQAGVGPNPFVGLPRRGQRGAAGEAPRSRAAGDGGAPVLPYPASAITPPGAASLEPVPRGTAAVLPYAQAGTTPSSRSATQLPAVSPYGRPASQAAGGTLAPTPADPGAQAIRAELDDIMQDRSAQARAGLTVRSNNGERGTSKMTMVEAPVEFRFPAGDGKVALTATPVQVRAGSVRDGFAHSSQFGGGPRAALEQAAGRADEPGKQQDQGIGLSAAYETRGLRADIGTTPLGFRRSNVVGGLEASGMLPGSSTFWYGADLSRRAVTDSVLSFAGARDERSGQTWGGITATGLQLRLGADYTDYGFYGSASWHALDGHNVESNTRTEVAAGLYRHLIREDDTLLTAGLHASATFYDNNQRFFTYGHGGYFSPQGMYYLGIPLTWAQRGDRWSYKVQGSVGVQRFNESGADYFPTSASMQADAEAAMAEATAQGLAYGQGARYGSQSSTGVGYSLSTAAEYQMAPNWFVGASAGLDNARDYRQWSGGLYLRYTLHPMTRALDLPVVPFQSPYRN